MSRLDYSKWDHIEISDDEDDTHPNVDTPSLFRWRHQARLDRMEERKKEWESLEKEKKAQQKKLEEVEQKLKKQQLSELEVKKVATTKEELLKQEEEFRKKEEELTKKDKLTPWNVDTICKEGFSKSIINKKSESSSDPSEEDFLEEQNAFQDKYKKELQHYGMLSKSADSRRYLQDNPHLICDKSANYLVIWCIDLEVEEVINFTEKSQLLTELCFECIEKTTLMERVAHQTIILQFILQLGIQMKTDPRNCYGAFFKRFETMQADYMESFNDELNSFKKRVKERARIRIEEAMKRYEKEQREKELGPGGLHPADVMETLPPELIKCFETQDIGMLQKVIKEMDPDEAKYHMKRCVDSGLWVPEGGKAKATEDPSAAEESEEYDSPDEIPPQEKPDGSTEV